MIKHWWSVLIMSSLQSYSLPFEFGFDHHWSNQVQKQADFWKALEQKSFSPLFIEQWTKSLKPFSLSKKLLTKSFFDTDKERSDSWSKTRNWKQLICLKLTQRNQQSGSLNQQFKNSFSRKHRTFYFITLQENGKTKKEQCGLVFTRHWSSWQPESQSSPCKIWAGMIRNFCDDSWSSCWRWKLRAGRQWIPNGNACWWFQNWFFKTGRLLEILSSNLTSSEWKLKDLQQALDWKNGSAFVKAWKYASETPRKKSFCNRNTSFWIRNNTRIWNKKTKSGNYVWRRLRNLLERISDQGRKKEIKGKILENSERSSSDNPWFNNRPQSKKWKVDQRFHQNADNLDQQRVLERWIPDFYS